MNVRLSAKHKVRILNTDDIAKVMQDILLRENKIRRNQEHFWVIGLNTGNKILFIELVSLGAANRVHVAPPEVFRMGIYKLAAKLILAHNHPSGNTDVSHLDKDFTDRMIKSGNMLKIEVVDHLIITEEGYTSFADDGLMEELRKSGRYELVDRERQELNNLKIELAIDNRNKEVATKLKNAGVDIEVIVKATGLKKVEINRLK
jgi:DNA repair protein RadC